MSGARDAPREWAFWATCYMNDRQFRRTGQCGLGRRGWTSSDSYATARSSDGGARRPPASRRSSRPTPGDRREIRASFSSARCVRDCMYISGLLVRCRLFRVQNAKAAPLGEHSRWLHDMAPRASRTIAATAPPTASCLPRSNEDANAAIGSSTASWCRSAMISRCSEARDWTTSRSDVSSETTTDATS